MSDPGRLTIESEGKVEVRLGKSRSEMDAPTTSSNLNPRDTRDINPLPLHPNDTLRRSTRERQLSVKALQNQALEVGQLMGKLDSKYESWRKCACSVRKLLKTALPIEQLQELHDDLTKHQIQVVDTYNLLKNRNASGRSVVAMVDNCCSLSESLLETLLRRRLESSEELDLKMERDDAKALKDAHPSVFGDSESTSVTSVKSHHSSSASIVSWKVKADTEKAENIVKARVLQEEQHQRSRILHLQLQMEEEKMKLEAMQADAAVRIAEAKCDVLSVAADQCDDLEGHLTISLDPKAPSFQPTHTLEAEPNPQPPVIIPPIPTSAHPPHKSSTPIKPANEVSSLAEALANAMDRNRLPVPTPKVFSGNPIEFVNFKRSFKTLIEGKGISAEEQIYYLRQYVAGQAKEAIAGCFYGNTDTDYRRAWETLEKRYGHPFKIAEAFRRKLDDWPRVPQRDGPALQRCSDFLRSCADAMPHIKGLSILNDCKENQKMAAKMPDAMITRWSRIATESLDKTLDYPPFRKFVEFVDKEARAAVHPVASFAAVKGIAPRDSRTTKDDRKSAGTLVTDADDSSSPRGPRTEKVRECPFCSGDHWLPSCPKFSAKSILERNKFVTNQKRCFGCLRTGHFSRQCKSRHICQKCTGRHPTVLHDENKTKKSPNLKPPPREEKSSISLKTISGQSSTTNVLPVWVSSTNNPEKEKLVYALLDTQSDSTFVDEGLCDELLVKTEPVKLKLSTMMGKDATVMSHRAAGLRVRGYTSGQHIDLPVAYTRDYIPLDREHIPTWQTAQRWVHLASIVHDMPPLLDCQVGLLIGYNCSSALAPRQVITGEKDQPYAVRTDLGWSIVGRLGTEDSCNLSGFCHRISLKESPPATPRDVLKVLERDFADSKDHTASVSQEDIQFLKFLEDNVKINSKGHIEMPLPFKSRPELPNNRGTAAVRLAHLKRKLERDDAYKERYVKFMEEMLRDGHAELAPETAEHGEVYYIPHHGIYHPQKPDKLRVVFDCSAKHKGTCLNSHLLSGPDLTNNLFGVLCRFRRERIAVMCDVQKMFHQFHVHPRDRDFLRFLWYEGGDTSKVPQEYRMNVHLFGAKSSPGCANFGLKHLSRLYEEEHPRAARFVRQDFYVDDGVTSVSSPKEATALIQEARDLCSHGNLRLHKFISNDRSVVAGIPVSERSAEIQEVDLSKEDLPVERTLGVSWNIETDALMFQINIKDRPNTRRGILSVVSSMFDPLGFIAPFVLEGKSVLQEMCKRGINWDEAISEDLRPRWEKWKDDIPNLKKITLQRCYAPPNLGPPQRVELHHFSDASTSGYGTCSYLRFIGENSVHCCLVAGKARVAPTKVVTVPRLELTAAVVAVKMSIKLKEELQMHIDNEYFWSDSQVVLAYINNEARKFHVFVSNRVQLIRDNSELKQWHYVPTKDNPADHASRGLSAAELLSSNWFTGPEFLWKIDPIENHPMDPGLMVGDPEVRAVTLNVQATSETDVLQRLSRYSTWNRLTRIVARIQRLARRQAGAASLTVEEINRAGLAVIKLIQKDAFPEELRILQNNREIPSTSQLYNLNPCLQDGLIRVGGRLRKADMSFGERHPIVLPKCHVTQLIVSHCHCVIRHQGRGQTLNEVRRSGYWVIGGSKMVAMLIKQCTLCRKLRRPVEEQRMADLPQDRVDPAPPFTHCGMDCFGPFITKQGRKEYKRYGLLLTCLCSRAVHIEVIEDMTTDAFLNALRCFIAIRGAVKHIRCDQGSNFIGARNELRTAMKELDVTRLTTYLTEKQCSFLFNAPHASHTGGVWERQIRSVRNILTATLALCPGRIDDASLRCYMYEAMSIINSRPLTPVDMSDPCAEPPITPNHLITMKPTTPLPPPGNFERADLYSRKRWRRVQFLSQQFWSRWRKEYLQNLQKREKWNVSRRNLNVGDVVLLKDDDAPRMEWPLGIITKANPDDDGLVRRVWVRTGSRESCNRAKRSELERPIQKVVLLVAKD